MNAAAEKYVAVPKEDSRFGLLLDDLHRKVSQVELGLLKEGVNEGEPDFDLDLSRGNK